MGATCESLSTFSQPPSPTASASLAGARQSGGGPHVAVSLAQTVGAGQFTMPNGRAGRGSNPFANLQAFCRVAATLTPSSDSDIKVEIWLPAAGWNGKLQAVGNGAWAGTISYPAMATALAAGYATVSTDTGHAGGNANFMVGHPEKLKDFEERAVHEMTVTAKKIVAAYYDTPLKAPLPTAWNFPFQPAAGSQTSILMSESPVGASVAATRQ